MRIYFVVALALACTSEAIAGDWRYLRNADSMGRGEIKTATVQSTNTVTFNSPYGGAQRAKLTLRSHPRWGRNVFLDIERGQFLCRVDGCSVMVRFDAGDPVRFSAAEPADHSSDTLFIQGYDRFVGAMRKAKRVRIEANFYHEGSRVLEFDVQGFDWVDLVPGKSKPAVTDSGVGEQQKRMQRCNQEAGERSLRGEERKQFMSACLKAALE